MTAERACAWCHGPIPTAARRDSLTCSQRCRQARNRFERSVGVGPVADGHERPLRLAYADPPYPGMSRRYYSDHPDYAGEVDHAELVSSLQGFDGWALSTSAASLQYVLSLCPPGVRVGAWHRGERPNPAARGPQNAWEPVIFAGGRARRVTEYSHDASSVDGRRVAAAVPDAFVDRHATDPGATRRGDQVRRIDSLVFHSRPRLTDPHRVVGAKPATFARWVFELLGATAGDEFVDVFPGSGGMNRAWRVYAGE